MKPLITCLLILSACGLQAQEWAPVGAKWTYGIGYAFGPGTNYVTWEVTGDSVIAGQSCRVIRRSGHSITGDIDSVMFTYFDSGRVFLYNPIMQDFMVFYDFDAQVDSGWTIAWDTCDVDIKVDSVGIDTINGFALPSMYISTSSQGSTGYSFEGKVIRYIGNMIRPSPDVTYHCFGFIEDMAYYGALRCYEDPIIGFVDFGIAPSCDYKTVGIPECVCPAPEFRFYPNPATDLVRISATGTWPAPELTVGIYELTGRLVKLKAIADDFSEMDVSSLSNGVYLVTIRAPGWAGKTDKLVIQR